MTIVALYQATCQFVKPLTLDQENEIAPIQEPGKVIRLSSASTIDPDAIGPSQKKKCC
jgi:hypothetical protein